MCDFTQATTNTNLPSFSLDDDATNANGFDTGSLCTEDYVEIDGLQFDCNLGPGAVLNSRICGLRFGAVTSAGAANSAAASSVCDCSKPFQIQVVTDTSIEAANLIDRGLCLDYQQIPC